MKVRALNFLLLLLIIFLESGCVGNSIDSTTQGTETPYPTPTVHNPMPQGTSGYPWWNDTVFYEVFVRSFYDSDGDGIGDIQGLIQKLDYLNDGDPATQTDLGITGLWLMPIFPSPSYHGYDVTDYRSINPDYGTMEDFELLIKEAHKRGIRVVIDFVINHTSTDHPWFKDARSGADSSYRDWYLWSDEKLTYLGPWNQTVWHGNYDGSYYYGIFWSGMPDLNYQNQDVTDEIFHIADYWLSDVGVDGFRVDGARHLIEEGKEQANTDLTHEWFQDFYLFYKGINSEAMTVGEIWDSNFSAVRYVKNDEFDLVFDFELAESIIEGLNGYDGKQIQNAFDFNTNLFPDLQKANFLTNHDMDRVMNVLQEDETKAKLASVLLLTSPGVPFIYYGEEIGMLGTKPDEDIRRPMQWTDAENAGFTTGYPWESLNQNFVDWNVAGQTNDPDSLLSLYRNLIQLRNSHAALRVGDYSGISTGNNGLVAYLRKSIDEQILVVVNVSKETLPVNLTFETGILNPGNYSAGSLLSSIDLAPFDVLEGSVLNYQPIETLAPGAFLILQFSEQNQ